jgi:uncharacterized protein (DUF1330 family)
MEFPMIYATVHMNVSDKSKIAAYREHAAGALAKHGGAVVAASPAPTLIEGQTPPNTIAILSFPSKEAALAWKNDPELSDIHALRIGAGQSDIALIG